MTKVFMTLMAALVLCMASAPVQAKAAKPTVVLIPGGGWLTADPAGMAAPLNDLRSHGIRARVISYPLGDPLRAERYMERVVSKIRGPVVLYGMSAGGTIAAALAATGQVAGAVNVEGPTDLLRWITPFGIALRQKLHLRPALLRAASPYWRLTDRVSPQLNFCGKNDQFVNCRLIAAYARASLSRQRDSKFYATTASHELRQSEMDIARQWIMHRWR